MKRKFGSAFQGLKQCTKYSIQVFLGFFECHSEVVFPTGFVMTQA